MKAEIKVHVVHMNSVGVIFFILQTKRVDLSNSNFTVGSFGFFSILGIKSVSSDTCVAVLHSASLWKTSKLYHLERMNNSLLL